MSRTSTFSKRKIGFLGSCGTEYCGAIEGYFCVRCRHYIATCRCGDSVERVPEPCAHEPEIKTLRSVCARLEKEANAHLERADAAELRIATASGALADFGQKLGAIGTSASAALQAVRTAVGRMGLV